MSNAIQTKTTQQPTLPQPPTPPPPSAISCKSIRSNQRANFIVRGPTTKENGEFDKVRRPPGMKYSVPLSSTQPPCSDAPLNPGLNETVHPPYHPTSGPRSKPPRNALTFFDDPLGSSTSIWSSMAQPVLGVADFCTTAFLKCVAGWGSEDV